MCRAMLFSARARALKKIKFFDADIVVKNKWKCGLSWFVLLSTKSMRHYSFPKIFSQNKQKFAQCVRALIENDKLVNQIARLAAIVVKFSTPLFRYFYNQLSNYTKTIIRLRLANIGEYSPRLRLGEYFPRRGKYPPLTTDTEVNSCFSIY